MSEKMYNDLVNQNSLLSSYTYANRLMEEYSLLVLWKVQAIMTFKKYFFIKIKE